MSDASENPAVFSKISGALYSDQKRQGSYDQSFECIKTLKSVSFKDLLTALISTLDDFKFP